MFIVHEHEGRLYRMDVDTGETWKLDAYRDKWELIETAQAESPDPYHKIGYVVVLRSPIQPEPCASCGWNHNDVATFPATITPSLVQFAFDEYQRDLALRKK